MRGVEGREGRERHRDRETEGREKEKRKRSGEGGRLASVGREIRSEGTMSLKGTIAPVSKLGPTCQMQRGIRFPRRRTNCT